MEEETKNKINSLLKSCNHRVIPSDDGTDISFRIWGDKGPVLLLLHGGYGSWLHWFNNIISLNLYNLDVSLNPSEPFFR